MNQQQHTVLEAGGPYTPPYVINVLLFLLVILLIDVVIDSHSFMVTVFWNQFCTQYYTVTLDMSEQLQQQYQELRFK